MPEYISLDKDYVFVIQDVVNGENGVVKTIIIYRWNPELRVYEMKEMMPLKLRHH